MTHVFPRDFLDNPVQAIFGFARAQGGAALCAGVNHLLKLEPELKAMLAHHPQATLQLRWPAKAFFPAGELAVRISDARLFEPCELTTPAQVIVTVLDGFLSADQDQKLRFLRVEGDAMLAQTLALLAQRLRWDAEHDVARWVGDAPAAFLARHARTLANEVLKAAKVLQIAVQESGFDQQAAKLCSLSPGGLKEQFNEQFNEQFKVRLKTIVQKAAGALDGKRGAERTAPNANGHA